MAPAVAQQVGPRLAGLAEPVGQRDQRLGTAHSAPIITSKHRCTRASRRANADLDPKFKRGRRSCSEAGPVYVTSPSAIYRFSSCLASSMRCFGGEVGHHPRKAPTTTWERSVQPALRRQPPELSHTRGVAPCASAAQTRSDTSSGRGP